MAQTVKRLPTMWETRVQSLGQEDLLEKEMAPHSSTLAWKIPRMEKPGRLQSMGSQRVRNDWATSLSLQAYCFPYPERNILYVSLTSCCVSVQFFVLKPVNFTILSFNWDRKDYTIISRCPFDLPHWPVRNSFGDKKKKRRSKIFLFSKEKSCLRKWNASLRKQIKIGSCLRDGNLSWDLLAPLLKENGAYRQVGTHCCCYEWKQRFEIQDSPTSYLIPQVGEQFLGTQTPA